MLFMIVEIRGSERWRAGYDDGVRVHGIVVEEERFGTFVVEALRIHTTIVQC